MEIVDYIVAEDKDLVKMSLVGDQMAFEYLFNRYSDAIRRLFLQRYTSVEDTEDLLQETFIKVYINLHRYSADYTFGQWVYTIARNTFVDFSRTRKSNALVATLFGKQAQTEFKPGKLVLASYRMSINQYQDLWFQDIIITEIFPLK